MDELILRIIEEAPGLGISALAMWMMFKMYNILAGRVEITIQENSKVMGEVLEAMRHLNGRE